LTKFIIGVDKDRIFAISVIWLAGLNYC